MEKSVKDSVIQKKQDETSTATNSQVQPLPPHTEQENTSPVSQSTHSYHPYSWRLLNRILDIVDEKTHGRAGWLQRLVSYLFFGGLAALTNLLVLYLMFYHVLISLNLPGFWHNTLSYVVASEISILANFIPNDRFTFHTLPGARRPWIQRCLRFHLTTIVGAVLTYLIELGLSSLVHVEPVRAEAIATLIVLIYNFSFHHIYTYRRIKGDPAEKAA
jgi:putative flippase GtrA